MIAQFLKLFAIALLLTFLTVLVIGFSTGTITIRHIDATTQSKDETP